MFNDNRSKRVVLVAHCLLNQNSISDGTADYPSQFNAVIDELMRHQIGLIQLPCPELTCLGLDRQDPTGGQRSLLNENTRIRNLLKKQEHAETLRRKAIEVAAQVKEYERHGMKILGMIGVNRSPSCGVETTTDENQEIEGCGVFIDALRAAFMDKELMIKMTGVRTSRTQESVAKVKALVAEDCSPDGGLNLSGAL